MSDCLAERGPAAAERAAADQAGSPTAPLTSTWAIGTPDDSSTEFAGPDANPYRVGLDPWSAFPQILAGSDASQTLLFTLTAPGPATLHIHGVDSAPNTPTGLLARINGHTLSPRWAASFASDAFGGWPNREQGVILLRWALSEEFLSPGPNTLTLQLMAADFGSPISPSIELDAAALITGSFQSPQRRVGTTAYWMNQELLEISKAENYKRDGTYRTWIDYLYDTDTLTTDLEILEELHVTAAYPDVTWNFVEPDFDDDWREGAYAYYHQTFSALQERGIRVLAKLQYTPRWASSNPASPSFDIYPPADWATWEDFCLHTAEVLSDVVDYWAVWNEVDNGDFWQPQPYQTNGYDTMFSLAYATLNAYDTVDADGDGIAAQILPSATDNPTDLGDWTWMYDTFHPNLDGLHVHDYMWGVLPDHLAIHAISPTLPYVISEFGPGIWYVGEPPYSETNPAGPMAFDTYILKDPASPVETAIQWILKGDPEKDAGPWPDPGEWVPLGGYANDDGFFESYGSSLVNLEPGGYDPPFTQWTFHSGGAYMQHQFWLYDLPGPQVPLEWLNPSTDTAVELSAVDLGNRLEVLVTHFAGGSDPVTGTVWTRLHLPWAHLHIEALDPDDPLGSYRADGPDLVLSATLALDTHRYIVRPWADLSPSQKRVNTARAAPGERLTYTLSLRNGGDAPAPTAWLDDTLPAGVTWGGWITFTAGRAGYADGAITWTGAISPQTPITVTFAVTACWRPVGAILTNSATLTGDLSLHGLGPVTTTVSPSPGVLLTPPAQQGTGPPGLSMTYPLTLSNIGNLTDTLCLALSSTWPASIAPFSLTLPMSESAPLTLTVFVPPGTLAGASDLVTVTATSTIDPAARATAYVTSAAAAVPGVLLTPPAQQGASRPGETAVYRLAMTNTGNSPDAFALTHHSNQSWPAAYDTPIALSAGQATTLAVTITVPTGVISDPVDVTTLTATSSIDPAVWASAQITTTASGRTWQIYLPLIVRPAGPGWGQARRRAVPPP